MTFNLINIEGLEEPPKRAIVGNEGYDNVQVQLSCFINKNLEKILEKFGLLNGQVSIYLAKISPSEWKRIPSFHLTLSKAARCCQ